MSNIDTIKEDKKIVVLGGSFNPPTIAHKKILEKAIDKIDADLGLFVPSSHNYVAKKMRKKGEERKTLPEQVRVKMLEAMCSTNKKLAVDTCELGDDGKGHTYDTLVKIRSKYPSSEIYFIIGYDTIKMIPRWHNKDKLVSEFKFIVYNRGGLDVQIELSNYILLLMHRSHFIQVDSPVGIEHISSTLVRDTIKNGNGKLDELMDAKALEILMANKHYFL